MRVLKSRSATLIKPPGLDPNGLGIVLKLYFDGLQRQSLCNVGGGATRTWLSGDMEQDARAQISFCKPYQVA